MARVLFLDTQQELARKVKSWFVTEGCHVDIAFNKTQVLRFLHCRNYDIVVLDHHNCGEFVEFHRKLLAVGGQTPILILPRTRERAGINRSGLMELIDEQLAKRARKELQAGSRTTLLEEGERSSMRLVVDEIVLETDLKRVMVAGKDVYLTRLEFDLLETMMRHPNGVITLERFNSRKDCVHYCESNEALRTCIKVLRRKLAGLAAYPQIRTVHGLGYRLLTSEANFGRECELLSSG
jgi:two-component system response regulator MprA